MDDPLPSSLKKASIRQAVHTLAMPEETIASEVLAASLGGAISAGVLYPLEVLKTKLQAVDDDDDDDSNNDGNTKAMVPYAIRLYKEEGWSVFFRGVETSSFQSALEKALYFFSYTALKSVYRSVSGSNSIGPLANLTLGYAADWAHLPVTLPVDAWTTKIQTSNEAPLKILLHMLQDDGGRFYKGLSAYTLLCFKPALQYTVYEQVKQIVVRSRREKMLSAAEAFVVGMVARTIATVLVFPFLRAKVLLQTAKPGTKKPSTVEVLREQWSTSGLAGLYQGITPELTRGIFSAALMLMLKERIAVVVREWVNGRQKQIRR